MTFAKEVRYERHAWTTLPPYSTACDGICGQSATNPARLTAGERKGMFDLFIGRTDEAIDESTQTTTKENRRWKQNTIWRKQPGGWKSIHRKIWQRNWIWGILNSPAWDLRMTTSTRNPVDFLCCRVESHFPESGRWLFCFFNHAEMNKLIAGIFIRSPYQKSNAEIIAAMAIAMAFPMSFFLCCLAERGFLSGFSFLWKASQMVLTIMKVPKKSISIFVQRYKNHQAKQFFKWCLQHNLILQWQTIWFFR